MGWTQRKQELKDILDDVDGLDLPDHRKYWNEVNRRWTGSNWGTAAQKAVEADPLFFGFRETVER